VNKAQRANTNRLNGAGWELILVKRARSKGLLALKNALSARPIGGNRFVPVKSRLDFDVIRRDGRVAYIDCKCFYDRFNFSDINAKQLERALLYQNWSIPSGFVVLFRKTDEVVFYSATSLAKIGSGNSFGPDEGLSLGHLSSFDLGLIFKAEEPVGTAPGSLPAAR
jgi:hypothetical protein